ncbi:DNA polymerase III subunit delta [Sphingomicrobium clamense]|uniref:DNA polymerase III subunit delta n=1 Tax=Sphingomicrobium clamense TaxID=2851013 RepID=A0ABS6V3L4_9SPHN|nr:DNA polymerase III subunit delta [Sphingomicrobium sp. B8]MBW0143945.1 DNA polymerase III subunit delta [Sphingomicrobium sp. B8]
MKTQRGDIPRRLDTPDPAIRFYLFHGADEASSRSHATRLLKAFGAAKDAMEGGAIKSDPAKLADEANALSMFGGAKAIWIEPAADEIVAGVEALLEAPGAEHPTIAIAGALRKTSKLLKATEASPHALAHISYAPEGREYENIIEQLCREHGLAPAPGVVSRIAGMTANNRELARQEVEKYALYLGSGESDPVPLEDDVVDRLGAGTGDVAFFGLGDRAMVGDIAAVQEGVDAMSANGSEAITILRAMQRRIVMLAPMQARVAAGEPASAVISSMGRALFWKDKPVVTEMLMRWSAPRLARLGERITDLERRMMFTQLPAKSAIGEELLAVARIAQSARRR